MFTNKTNKKQLQQLLLQHQQPTMLFEVFKEHWKQILIIFNKSLINDDDIHVVKNNLAQIVNILLNELNSLSMTSHAQTLTTNDQNKSNKRSNNHLIDSDLNYLDQSDYINKLQFFGPIWDFSFKNNLFESIYLWSLSYPEYLYDLKYEQLKYYECLINSMQINDQTNLLLYPQLNRPLFSLLNHCSTHKSELIEHQMISILNQLCVCMCKNTNLLNIFFEHLKNYNQMNNNGNILNGSNIKSNLINNMSIRNKIATSSNHINMKLNSQTTTTASKFFIFSLLIPYIHREGSIGRF
jgi:hypothetical protein